MKIKFKDQHHQNDAVKAVIDCFKGRPKVKVLPYRIDLGENIDMNAPNQKFEFDQGFKNG